MNRVYRVIWSRALRQSVVASELATAQRGGVDRRASAVAMLRSTLFAAMLFAGLTCQLHAQDASAAITNTSFETGTLDGWTAGGGTGAQSATSFSSTGLGVSVVTGMTGFDSTNGEQPGLHSWTVTPYGSYMASLQAGGSSYAFATGATALGLSSASQQEVETLLSQNGGNGTPTNAAWIYQDITLAAGQSFTMAWQYVSTDYVPFNDASLTSLVNLTDSSSMATVNNLSAQYALLGATNPNTGNYSTGSYGATGWEVATYSVTEAGTYRLGFLSFNLSDTVNSPILLIDQAPGLTFDNGVPFDPISPNPGSSAPTTPVTPSTPVVSTPTTSSSLDGSDAVFDGGTLVSDGNGTLDQNFTINGTGGTIDNAGTGVVLSGTLSDSQAGTPGSLTLTNSGEGGTITLTGENTYTGSTTIDSGTTLALADNGSVATSSGVVDNGMLDISGKADAAEVTTLSGTGTVALGNNDLQLTNASGTFGGTITGNGGLVLDQGTEALTGTNTYTGDTTLNGGTLQVGNDANLGDASGAINFHGGTLEATDSFTSSRDIHVLGPATINTDTGVTLTDTAGTVSGNGTLTKTGNGTLILGADNGGGLNVAGGALQLTGAGSDAGVITIDPNATLALTGNGSVANASRVVDNGTFDISDAHGGEQVKTLAGNGAVTLGGNDLTLTQANDTFGGSIAGTGGLAINSGSETLTGSNTYTGTTQIDDGATLSLSGNGTLDHSAGIVNNGTFDISGANGGAQVTTLSGNGNVSLGGNALELTQANGNFAGNLGGSGGLEIAGGTEALSGANTYTGYTQIDPNSTLALTGDGSVAQSAGVIDNGTFDISGANGNEQIKTLFGSGTVALGGNSLELSNANGLFAGTIGGTGGVTVNGGGEALAGVNTYTGSTQIDSGATLALIGNGSLANSSGVVANGTFDISNGNGREQVTTLSGNGSVALGGNDLELTQAGGTFAGTIGGSAGVVIDHGTEVLSGTNTYAGGTTLNGGTLKVNRDANLGDASGAINFHGGTLEATGSFASTRDLNLQGPATIITDNGVTLTDTAGSVSGSGVLTKSGNGTLILGADNGGGLKVAGGTLQLTGAGHDSGVVTIDPNATLALTGNGSVANASRVVDNGTFDISGKDGNAQVTTLAGNGAVALGGNSLELTSAHDAFDGSIGGQGGVILDSGTLVLNGSNSYSGGTTLNGGTLQVSRDANLGAASGPVTFNGGTLSITQSMDTSRNVVIQDGGAAIDTANGVTVHEAGNISGSGGLVKLGGGTLVVSGTNTFTGGTLIDGGVVKIDTGSSLGTGAIVLNGGTLQTTATLSNNQNVIVGGNSGVNVDAGTTAVLSGNILAGIDTGCFVKSGLGKLNMTGSAVLPNGTCVQEGTLSANGALTSDVQVYEAGELRGTGAIDGGIDVKGRLAPGNSPGTLTAHGAVTMHTGSSLEVDIDGTGTGTGAGNYSRLIVAGAQNQFTAAGALVPTLRGITGNASNAFTPSIGDIYHIVYAEGGINGRFDTLVQPEGLAQDTRMVVFYNVGNNHSIDLSVLPSSYATLLNDVSATRNAISVGGALDKVASLQAQAAATDQQSMLLYSVAGTRTDQLAGVLGSLAGEVYADEAAAARNAGLAIEGDAMGHLRSDDIGEPGRAAWVNLTHDGARATGDAQGSGFTSGLNQISLGVDLYARAGSVVGLGVSHQENDIIASNGQGNIRGDAFMVYGQQAAGAFVVDGVASYGQNTWRAHRNDPVAVAGTLQGNADGTDAMAGVTVRLPMSAGDMRIEPYVSAVWQRVARDGFAEQGDSPAALRYDALSSSGSRVLAGLSFGSQNQDPLRSQVTYRVGVAAGVDNGGLLSPVVHATLAGESIEASGPRIGKAFANVQASGTLQLDKSTYLYGSLGDEAGSRRSNYNVTAGVRVTF